MILRTRDTPCPWLVACDANMELETCEQGEWLRENAMIIQAPAADVSMCRFTGSVRAGVERIYGCVVGPRGGMESRKRTQSKNGSDRGFLFKAINILSGMRCRYQAVVEEERCCK